MESNWNSTDFNITKTLIAIEEGIISMSHHTNKFTYDMVRDMLHLDLGLSHDLTLEIINDFEVENDNFRKTIISYWNEHISNLYEYEFILSKNSEECFELLDLEIRKFVKINNN